MTPFRLALVAASGVLALAASGPEPVDRARQWPSWRGPLGTGVAPHADPPIEWSEESNIRWKRPLPGVGHSTPVVWDDRIFLTTAVPVGESSAAVAPPSIGAHDNVAPSRTLEFVVLALSRADGSVLWRRTVRRERPHESTHSTGSWASSSAVTDGEHLLVSFGSRGVYGLDLDGDLLWERDLGDMRIKHGHGEASSPALHGDTLVLNWDHEGDSFLAALDKRSGELRWQIARQEGTSWSTPIVVEADGKPQVIVSATGRVRGYALTTGELIWECAGLSGNVVASPVAADGVVYVANSYETRAMLAIRFAGASGDLTATDAVLWRRDRDTPYVPSPLLYGDELYFLKHYQGLLTAVRAETGESLYGPSRLPGVRNVYASPVGAGGRIYITGREGATLVLRSGAVPEVLAVNRLDDSFSASPVPVGRELYLRGRESLYSISSDPVQPSIAGEKPGL